MGDTSAANGKSQGFPEKRCKTISYNGSDLRPIAVLIVVLVENGVTTLCVCRKKEGGLPFHSSRVRPYRGDLFPTGKGVKSVIYCPWLT